MSYAPWSYRPALDGLRSLAVYLVVLYHCGVGLFGGGFIGVDLFFVLSGFLVSTILYEELDKTGRIDLGHFYDRRIRRLLPAALVLVLAVCCASLLLFSTVRRLPLVGDAQAALLYVANWRFLFQTNDYFGAVEVAASPFLHFWSLSIEEQFYFFFPVLLVLLHRFGRGRRGLTPLVLSVLFAASLVAQLVWMGVDENHAYYGTDARLYQLLAGALLALALRTAGRRRRVVSSDLARAVFVGALIGMVLSATSVVDIPPGYRGMLATVFGSALVAVLSSAQPTLATRIFSWSPLVYLGKISYGTYLWHWPVVVLLGTIIDTSVMVRTVIVAVLSTSLAAASYQMLERPIRSRRIRPRLQLPVVAAGLAASVAVALVVVPPLLHQPRKPSLVAGPTAVVGTAENATGPVPDIDFAAVAADKGPSEKHCAPGELDPCIVVDDQGGPNVVLVGDSHGQMLARSLRRMARTHGFNLMVDTVSGCPWQIGLVKAKNKPARQTVCAEARENLYTKELEEYDADVVILTQLPRDSGADGNLLRPPGDDRPEVSRDKLLIETTDRTLQAIEDAGARALIVQSIWLPPSGSNPLDCLASARRLAQCRVPVAPRSDLLDALYLSADAASDNVYTVDINPLICPTAPVCDAVSQGVPVWRDALHYSPAIILKHSEDIYSSIVATGVFDGLDGLDESDPEGPA